MKSSCCCSLRLWEKDTKNSRQIQAKYLLNRRKVSRVFNWTGLHYSYWQVWLIWKLGERVATLTVLTEHAWFAVVAPLQSFQPRSASTSVCCLFPLTCGQKTGLEQNPNKNISNALLFVCFCESMSVFFIWPSCAGFMPGHNPCLLYFHFYTFFFILVHPY